MDHWMHIDQHINPRIRMMYDASIWDIQHRPTIWVTVINDVVSSVSVLEWDIYKSGAHCRYPQPS
jgi:hypothetical protein